MIDFHTHTQPDPALAAEFLGWIEGSWEALGWPGAKQGPHAGTIGELLPLMADVGIRRTLIVPWLPAQDLAMERMRRGESRDEATRAVIRKWFDLNEWAATEARTHPGQISALVGVDPVLMQNDQVRAEVAARLKQGACGIKIAPMFFDVPPSSEQVDIVWTLAREHGVFVLSQCGAHCTMGHDPWGHPKYFYEVLQKYPEVNVQLAHLGQGAEDEVIRLARTFPNVYADLSMRLTAIDQPGRDRAEDLVAIIREIGAERVVYGTNYPLVNVRDYAAAFDRLPLTDSERALIGWENAEALLAGGRRH